MDQQSAGIHAAWIIMADHAEVINGKLYLMGGGWDVLTVQQLPVHHPFGVALSFEIPWNECNQKHPFRVLISGPDGEELVKIEGDLEIGRPPGMQIGQSQRMPIAFNGHLEIKSTGTYAIKTYIHDTLSGETRFNVVPGPQLQLQQRLSG